MRFGRVLLFVGIGFLLLLVQSIFFRPLGAAPWMPNLALPVVVWASTSTQFRLPEAGVVAFLLGYFCDIFSGLSMGIHTVTMVIVFLVVTLLSQRIRHLGPGFLAGLTSLFAAFCVLFMYVLRGAVGPVSANLAFGNLAYQTFASATATGVFGYAILWLIQYLVERLNQQSSAKVQ